VFNQENLEKNVYDNQVLFGQILAQMLQIIQYVHQNINNQLILTQMTVLQVLELFVVSILEGEVLISEVDISNNFKLKSFETTHFLQSLHKFTGSVDFNQLLESIMMWLLQNFQVKHQIVLDASLQIIKTILLKYFKN